MSIGMAPPLYLPQEEFVYTASSAAFKPAATFPRSDPSDESRPDEAAAAPPGDGRAKKTVTFADQRGLPLTRVKVFSQFSDPIDIPANIQAMLSSAVRGPAPPEDDKLVLDFAPPSSDYLLLHQRLEQNRVSLERCVLRDGTLSGTVKVRNLAFEKRVSLRLSADGWRSHAQVDCAYTRDAYPSAYSDTFAFETALPQGLAPHQHLEFAVCYRVDGREYWDSNHGDNYRIVWSSKKTSGGGGDRHTGSRHYGIHFDPYGSPTCSHGVFPDWPSYAGYENIGPYY